MSSTNPFHNRPDEWEILDPLEGDSMLELGNKKNGPAIYKHYFEALGFRHVSIDWNGEDGALKRDLRQPLWEDLGQFDMLTNFGTTEHVIGQPGVWQNIHELVKTGGLYVGQTPYHDGLSWWWHGDYYPTEDFFRDFADKNGWEIERMYKNRERPYENLYVRMRKHTAEPYRGADYSLIKKNVRRSR